MRAAVINDGYVTNVVEVNELGDIPNVTLVASDTADIGDSYLNGVFSKPPVSIPSVVSMYQARTALSRAGLLATVESALASMPGQAGEEARIKWEYAIDVRREDALVAAMAGILNLDSSGLDSLFTTASEII